MAEVGLLPFARAALGVCRAVLPSYRTRFSKHQFTQPQLLAILCLMRFEDWTFREAEVRLGEHRELRQTLGLSSVPDFTTLYRFLERLNDQTLDQAVGETVRRMGGWRRRSHRRARVAVDATGLAQGAVSTFFVRRMHHHGQKPLPWRHWLKWVVVVDLDHQFVLSQSARRGPWNDCASLPAMVEAASHETRIGVVLADAEFDSERNHTYIRQRLGARSVIPAKRGKKTWRVRGVRAEMRRAFPRKLYRRRALIETVFSSVKRKLSARAPGRLLSMQQRQALLLGLSFNLYRLRHRYLFLRMSTEPASFGSPAVRKEWFSQVLEMAFVSAITGDYQDFGTIGKAALEVVEQKRSKLLTSGERSKIFATMWKLPAHADVKPGLERLKRAGMRMVVLTNSPPQMAETQLRNADLRDYFERVFSVDSVRCLKPSPEVYRQVGKEMRIRMESLLMVAAHSWDIEGAMHTGCRGAFIARPGHVLNPLTLQPDFVAGDIGEFAERFLESPHIDPSSAEEKHEG